MVSLSGRDNSVMENVKTNEEALGAGEAMTTFRFMTVIVYASSMGERADDVIETIYTDDRNHDRLLFLRCWKMRLTQWTSG